VINIVLKMVLFTKVNGRVVRDMVMGYRFGLMGPDMKGSGRGIRLMEGESSGMWMAIYLTESGRTIRLMDMGYIHM
jgi:hypothetical protein